jgi:osmotically-inducible protein OsmY
MGRTIASARWRLRATLLIGGVLLALVASFAVATQKRHIEDDLSTRARAALEERGITVEHVEFEGRDGVLRGAVASHGDRLAAVEIVSSLRGVRAVVDEMVVRNDPAPSPEDPQTTPRVVEPQIHDPPGSTT